VAPTCRRYHDSNALILREFRNFFGWVSRTLFLVACFNDPESLKALLRNTFFNNRNLDAVDAT
jgi:hypothetical protein